jgi:hypothetical protein
MILVGMNTWNGRPAFNGNRPWMFRDAFMTSALRIVFIRSLFFETPNGLPRLAKSGRGFARDRVKESERVRD